MPTKTTVAKNENPYFEADAQLKELDKVLKKTHILPVDKTFYVMACLISIDAGIALESVLEAENPGQVIVDSVTTYLEDKGISEKDGDGILGEIGFIAKDNTYLQNIEIKKGKKVDTTNTHILATTYIWNKFHAYAKEAVDIDIVSIMFSFFNKKIASGVENDIVLTPPYVTQLMARIIGVEAEDIVIDPCCGSGAFLNAALTEQYDDAFKLNKDAKKIPSQVYGIEFNMRVYHLALLSMVFRGTEQVNLYNGNCFDVLDNLDIKPTKALINPPYSYKDNGMPFALAVLDKMEKGGKLAIIIQDSAGSGRAIETNKKILENHSLIYSVSFDSNLFSPAASVTTSIYVFEAHKKHTAETTTRFIDMTIDGYKRGSRGIKYSHNFTGLQRYYDALDVAIYGDDADDETEVPFVDSHISLGENIGTDWNYISHFVFDTEPTEEDFQKTVRDYMMFELSMIMDGKGHLIGLSDEVLAEVNNILDEEEWH